MKSRLTLVIAILISANIDAFSDFKYITENEKYLYWQPGVMIEYDNYKDAPDRYLEEYEEDFKLTTFSNMTIHSVLDLPADSTSGLLEKAYFGPVMRKYSSSTLYDDPAGFRLDQLYFNICELSARLARKSLDSVLNANGRKYGILQKYFFHYKVEMLKFLTKLSDIVFTDIGLAKKTGAFERWEKIVNALLKKTENYATKPEECYRFISSNPILENYVKASTIYSDPNDYANYKGLNKHHKM